MPVTSGAWSAWWWAVMSIVGAPGASTVLSRLTWASYRRKMMEGAWHGPSRPKYSVPGQTYPRGLWSCVGLADRNVHEVLVFEYAIVSRYDASPSGSVYSETPRSFCVGGISWPAW